MIIKKIKKISSKSDIENSVIVGDCFTEMKKIKSNSFDMIFVDPPYNMQLQNELYRPNNTKVDGVNDKWDKFKNFQHYDDFTAALLKKSKRIF